MSKQRIYIDEVEATELLNADVKIIHAGDTIETKDAIYEVRRERYDEYDENFWIVPAK